MTKDERQKIIAFEATHDWSYQLVADHFGITRNQVAGILFRHRHPYSERCRSPNCAGGRNKIGTGYRNGIFAAMTAANTR
jgi:hypothetical protein